MIGGIGFLIFYGKYQQKPNTNNNQNNEIKLNSQMIEEKVIASNGTGFPHFTLQSGGEEFIIATYSYTYTPDKFIEDPGFLVFKYDKNNIEKIFKSAEEFPFGEGGVSFSDSNSLKDLDNDGVKELIIYADEARGYNTSIWIYKWYDNSFKFISPAESDKNNRSAFYLNSTDNFQFIDADNDGKIEASLLYRDYVRLGPGPDDIRIDIYKRIYKWDGTEKPYYLWKEEKINEK